MTYIGEKTSWRNFSRAVVRAQGPTIRFEQVLEARKNINNAINWWRTTNMNSWPCGEQDAAGDRVDQVLRENYALIDAAQIQRGKITPRLMNFFRYATES